MLSKKTQNSTGIILHIPSKPSVLNQNKRYNFSTENKDKRFEPFRGTNLQKIIILDCLRGKIECLIQNKHLLHGTLVNYVIEEKHNTTFLSYIDIVDIPNKWVSSDIFFLHHLLEMCSVYIPEKQNSDEIFNFLKKIYRPLKTKIDESIIKKLFLCKLISLLGMHPNEENLDYGRLFLILQDEKSILKTHIDIEKKLTLWLSKSLEQFEASYKLKTFAFIKFFGLVP
jgi:hypothetical protein